MKLRTRILLGFLVIAAVSLAFLLRWIVEDLKPQYRKATEEPLVDTARILASVASASARAGEIDIELLRKIFTAAHRQVFLAKIYDYDKSNVDLRIYVTNRYGRVLFDSQDGRAEGEDYSNWRDVRLTLAGEYGARTSADLPDNPHSSVMYVAAPILIDGEIKGVLSVGKPTSTANRFVENSRKRIIVGGTVTFIVTVLVAGFLSRMITNPIQLLMQYARDVRDGKLAPLPKLKTHELHELGQAFDEMRDALEGKRYVEQYVQTLTHEVKGPLSAIAGASELLKEEMPLEERRRFLDNITGESERMRGIVDKLLLLSNLESRKGLGELEEIKPQALLEQIRDSRIAALESKQLGFVIKSESEPSFAGEAFLVQHAFENIIQNSIEFTAAGGKIEVLIEDQPGRIVISFSDNGSGIPDYALERVFDRFYSLKRPDTQRKSSGLGLSLVREVAFLHHGAVSVRNRAEGGVTVVLEFPKRQVPV